MTNLLQQTNQDLSDVIAEAERSLVRVHDGHRGGGAGSIWHPDGLIVTNAHVVQGRSVQVTLPDGACLPASLLGYDAELDLAALSVDATGLTPIKIGESRNLRPGQWVLALGHPLGVHGAATVGVFIGAGSEFDQVATGGRELIAFAAPLRPGNSGGPLLDVHGRLVGINTMMAGSEVGLAVPVHLVKSFLRRMLGGVQASDSS